MLGHSTGGAIGVAMALDHPERLSSLLIYASTTHGDAYRHRVFGLRKLLFEAVGRDAYAQYTSLLLYPPIGSNAHDAELREMEATAGASLGAPEVQASRLDAILRFDRRAEFGRIALPVRVLCAEDDILTPRYFSANRPADRRRRIGLHAARRPRAVPHRAGVVRRGRAPLPGRPRMMRIPAAPCRCCWRRCLPAHSSVPGLRGRLTAASWSGKHGRTPAMPSRCRAEREAWQCGDTGDGWRPWHCCPAAPWRRPAGRASRHGRSRRPRRLWQRPAPRPPAWCGRRCRSIPASRPRRRSPPRARRRSSRPRHARRRPAGQPR